MRILLAITIFVLTPRTISAEGMRLPGVGQSATDQSDTDRTTCQPKKTIEDYIATVAYSFWRLTNGLNNKNAQE
ncbi:MAG TPA: hypothetical protein VHA52_06310 [Candidatus Babeliaceae bacterium]|nr:hypothetical protein [Candidatus Babeliaceae bacterium]